MLVEGVSVTLEASTVTTAYEIADFADTKHPHLQLIEPSTAFCVQHILNHVPRPTLPQQVFSDRDRRARARSQSLDLSWPPSWAIDRSAFRDALRRFDTATRELRELLLQPPSPITTKANPPNPSADMAEAGSSNDRGQGQNGHQQQPPTGDPEVLRAMRQMIREDMRILRDDLNNTLQRTVAQQQPPQPPVPPQQPAPDPRGKLRVEDLGYFDPYHESDNNEAIVSVGRHVYYRDMFVWVDHLKDLVKTHDEATVRSMVAQALRGGALTWYSTELTELEKDFLRDANMDRWYKTITDRFKERGPEAQDALDRCAYTLQDVKNGRTPRAYVQDIIRHAKATGLPLYNQLLLAYTKIHYKLRVHLTEPTTTTTLASFLEQLDSKTNAFYDIARDELGGGRSLHQASQVNRGKGKQAQYFQPSSRQQEVARQAPLRPFVSNYQSQYPTSYRFGQAPYQGYQSRPFYQNYSNTQPQSQQQALAPSARQAPPTAGQGYGSQTYPNKNGYTPAPQGAYIKQEPAGNFNDAARSYNRPQRPQRPQRPREAFGNRPRAAAYQADDAQDVEEADPDAEPDDTHHEEDQEAEEGFHGNDELAYYYPREEDSYHQSDAHFATPSLPIMYPCRRCQAKFTSKNLLHKHLRAQECQKPSVVNCRPINDRVNDGHAKTTAEAFVNHATTEVIKSNAEKKPATATPRHLLRLYHYLRAVVKLSPEAIADMVCWDTGCSVTLIDRAFLKAQLPKHTILRKELPLVVRGIGSSHHSTTEYVNLDIYVPGRHNGRTVDALIQRPAFVVDNLRAKMLIGMDVLAAEDIDLTISTRTGHIGSCRTTFDLTITPTRPFIKQDVMLKKPVTIPAKSHFAIPIEGHDLPSGDFMFEPANGCPVALFASLVDSSFHAVLARNDSDQPISLPKNLHVGSVMDIEADGCYHVSSQEAELAVKLPKQTHQAAWSEKAFARLADTLRKPPTTAQSIDHATNAMTAQDCCHGRPPEPSAGAHETTLPNGVTVYGTDEDVAKLTAIVEEFAELWHDKGGAVDLPQEDWMRIPLRPGWESKITGKPKVYHLGIKDRAIVDKVFDKLQAQGRLEYTKHATPFCFPVFVVHKMVDGKDEGRPVVDIRMLNQVSIRDAYPLPPQDDLISLIAGCLYVTCVDGASFFYQWRVHPADRYKQTVVTHRGQETFLVPLMGYCNSPAYVQRQTDRLLREFKEFAKGYVDDIIIFSKTLQEHLMHLRQVFTLFLRVGIALKPSKSFMGYPNVQLLGQRVDSFGLSTPQERLAAISKLKFPQTLTALETYLGMTGYLRNYIAWYAQIARPLQDRKTELLKPSPKGGRERKSFAATTRLSDPSEAEVASFNTLQDLLSRPSYLIHFNPHWTLYIDIDASKDLGFGVVVYHDWAEASTSEATKASEASSSGASNVTGYTTTAGNKRTKIRPIMFLSRLLTSAEGNYWPTELEVAGLVWTVRKIRHLIESSRSKVVVYTDHAATIDIAKQGSLTTTSTVRLNLRLVRASQYLQRFELDVRHKPGKKNVVPDALSRLASTNVTHSALPQHDELEALHGYAYTTTLVGMSEDFKRRIVKGYQVDPSWKKVLAILYSNDSNEDVARLPFVLGEKVDITEANPTLPQATESPSPNPTSPQPTNVRPLRKPSAGPVARAVAVRVPLRKPSANAHKPQSPLRPHRPLKISTDDDNKSGTPIPANEQRAIAVRVPVKPPSAHAFPVDDTSEAIEASRNCLIYHVDKATGARRLCIPQAVVKDVLDIAHTAEGHLGFARCYERVAHSWCIKGLSRYLRDYLKHCPECLVYQTRRHAPYGSMQPIYSPPIPFHTLTIDFILALPLTKEGFDSAMSVTCKFSKRVTFIPGKGTFKAMQWAVALLERLELGDWGIPKVILSDRDPKFLSELWSTLFESLKVKLLYSTAYHPQTDGQSERTNQTAEIMLRFFITGLEHPRQWPHTLSRLQAVLNSSTSASTEKSANEVTYGFRPNQPLDLVAASSMPELNPAIARISAVDALAFASMSSKYHYDRRHKSLVLKEGQSVYLRLHKGYNIPANASITRKLGQQYAGPFKVLRRIGKLAYKLDLPQHWRIHPVISIAMLEPTPSGEDPFNRPVPEQPDSVYVEGDTETNKSWEVERIVDKQGEKYLVRWKGYGPEEDRWRTKAQLGNAMDLVRDYEDGMLQTRNDRSVMQQFGLRRR